MQALSIPCQSTTSTWMSVCDYSVAMYVITLKMLLLRDFLSELDDLLVSCVLCL